MSSKKEIYRKIKAKTESIRENSALAYLQRPLFTVSGNNELVVEGQISVEKYGETEIIITVSKMTVTAIGRGLTMCFYNRNAVKITGFITALNFDGM